MTFALLTLGTALAGPYGAYASPRALPVSRVDVDQNGNMVTLRLDLEPGTIDRLARMNIRPELIASSDFRHGERARVFPITSDRNVWTVSLPYGVSLHDVELDVRGFGYRGASVNGFEMGGVYFSDLDIRVDHIAPRYNRYDHDDRDDWRHSRVDPATYRACQVAFVGTSSEARCMALASAFAFPVETVQACDRAMVGDTSGLSCLETVAVRPWVDPRVAVAACDRALVGDGSELACIATTLRTGDVGRVDRCDDWTIGDVDALACIQDGGRDDRWHDGRRRS